MGNDGPSSPRGRGEGRASLLDEPLIASGRRLGERYRLERRLGHGGMAVVWLATDERLDRPVAIKVLSDTVATDDEYLRRFRREARVAARLHHPNLVGVYDFAAGTRPYLVMEYLPGGDLGSRLEAGDVADPERLARELLSALRHIHAAGVLHRDIKPQNVLIDADGRARLTDFGIAQPRDAASLTRTGHVIGTERYIAPEVMGGEPASERSDLFGLGVVLAEVGHAGGGGSLRALTDRLRDPDPAGRPASAAAALAALDRGPTPGVATQPYAIDPPPTTEPLPAPTEEPPPDATPPRRPFEPTLTRPSRGPRRWAIAAVVAVVLGGAAAIAIGLGAGDDPGSQGPRLAQGDGGEGAKGGAERADKGGSGGAEATTAGSATAPDDQTTTTTTPTDEVSSPLPATDGASLNDQGFQLVQQGSFEEAVPVLQRAVEALEGSGDEQTYNYALFNLATAYLGAGNPEAAIPLLEQRMQYDNQLDTVQATLDEARAAAGQAPPEESTGGDKPGKGPKPKQPKPPKEKDRGE